MSEKTRRKAGAFGSGAAVGFLGGLIGLGGAEFRLPILISLFGFPALPAVILNKAMSLVVVAFSLPFRARSVPVSMLLQRWDIIVILLAGSIIGAWFGAGLAISMKSRTLYKTLSALLVLIAFVLLLGHEPGPSSAPALSGTVLILAGVSAGFCIGVVAALMGVAGGELLIPVIILLFGVDVKLAGSLSLAVSLPTMIIGFTRYSRSQSFSIIRTERNFLLIMAVGSIAGALAGGLALGLVPGHVLLPLLAAILVVSAAKVWRHA